MAPTPGEITFAVKGQLSRGASSHRRGCRAALRFAFHELKLVVEPGGAVALAAVLTGKLPTRRRVIGVVLSGGNVDPVTFAEILGA